MDQKRKLVTTADETRIKMPKVDLDIEGNINKLNDPQAGTADEAGINVANVEPVDALKSNDAKVVGHGL